MSVQMPPDHAHARLLSQVRFWVIGLGLLFCLIGILDGQDSDVRFYLPMFNGIFEGIKAPFSSRVLYPLLVSLISGDFPVEWVTWTASALMSVGFLWILKEIFEELGFPPLLKWVGVAGGYLPFTFTEPMMPDLIGMLLFALIILLWIKKQPIWAIAMMFPLAMARESYLLFALVLVALAWRSQYRWYGVAAFVIFGLGMFAASLVTDSIGNRQGLSSGLYLLLKIPVNFARNYLGLSIWTETLDEIIQQRPDMVFELPPFLQVGEIRSVGIVEWNFSIMAWTFASVLGLHGLAMPLYIRGRHLIRQTLRETPWILRVVAVASLVTIVLGPSLGATVSRLVGYGWPMASVIVPLVLMRLAPERRDKLAVIHLVLLSVAASLMFGYEDWVTATRLVVAPLTIFLVLFYALPALKRELAPETS